MSLENLQQYSASTRELVLPLPLALEAIALMEQLKIPVFGWEGWIRLPGGRLGHSALHQGNSIRVRNYYLFRIHLAKADYPRVLRFTSVAPRST